VKGKFIQVNGRSVDDIGMEITFLATKF